MTTRRRKPINREPLPFKAFILGSRKYRVVRWGETVKGQRHLIVKNVITCTNKPWPSIQIGSEDQSEFPMRYPIKVSFSEFKPIYGRISTNL